MNGCRTLAAVVLAAASLVATAPRAHAAPTDWEITALKAAQARSLSQKQGEGVTVAVIDTGVEDRHPALRGKVTQGPDYVPGGVKRGDRRWGVHGTAMAHAVLKIAPKARILSIRGILEREDPSFNKKSSAGHVQPSIQYAVDHGADVISLSLGSDGTFDLGNTNQEQRAVGYAISKGIPVLAGAGNDGRAAELNQASFPAGLVGAIAVAAVKPDGGRAEFSTVRSYNDVAAPGVAINSAQPGGGYKAIQGTSPATALASGVVALMKSRNPRLTPAEVRTILRTTATGSGWSPVLGYGRIDAARAVQAAANPPRTLKNPVPHKGKSHLGKPTGVERKLVEPMETSLIVTIAVAFLLGLALLGGGLMLRRRRHQRPIPAGGPPMGGPPMGGPPMGGPPMGGPPMGGPPMGGPR
ncbi:S8 family serine peptidase [Actinomadura sp. B10D3]|uniref:S8 family peptidase n=1 Tax=Actinomadura sp. B10D3 TaxID=3153557 RepID=UPI00325DE1CD